MREKFIYFSGYKEDEFSEAWKNALFVFDTNVLLNLYRYKETTRQDFLKLFDQLNGRIWIPHHVALEFYRNRLTVISDQNKSFEDVKKIVSDSFNELEQYFKNEQFAKRHALIDPTKFIASYKEIKSKFLEELENLNSHQLQIKEEDFIKNKIEELFSGKVGSQFKSQDEIDALFKIADTRFDQNIPPGYKDTKKDKDGEVYFSYDGLRYQKKYGDYIIWSQILSHAKFSKEKTVFLITGDGKSDWWETFQGRTIGPRMELKHEAHIEGEIDFFHMYNVESFLKYANQYFSSQVSSDSIQDVNATSQILNYLNFHASAIRANSMGLIEYSPDILKQLDIETFSQISIKFSNPVDRTSVSYVGIHLIRSNIFVPWDVGGWVEYAEDDTKIIWHPNLKIIQDEYKKITRDDAHYPLLELHLGRPGTAWAVTDISGNALPHIRFDIKFHPPLEFLL
ncbi:hypothetical protein UNDYM_4018 [Undibacterium sp. YM2]|uniref:PIN-like domain-containing protein n=1 Tax=Undibacterium sp. YM2 TaxID=2058625 RepID=UPI001331FC24|nr:PIN-like domain-containing protein [Undibacterium sp. YM2]BBB68271.1 hypothetical protein UNDYM_4018 [Undibacterium sp. YM2]